jgi:hypothetical protein
MPLVVVHVWHTVHGMLAYCIEMRHLALERMQQKLLCMLAVQPASRYTILGNGLCSPPLLPLLLLLSIHWTVAMLSLAVSTASMFLQHGVASCVVGCGTVMPELRLLCT